MQKVIIDLAQLNTDLSSEPVAIGGHPQVCGLVEVDPSLRFLSCDAAEAEIAQATCTHLPALVRLSEIASTGTTD